MRAPKDGSGSPSLVAAANFPQGLVVVGSTVYWVDSSATTGTIHQAPSSGGSASAFATLPAIATPTLYEIVTDGSSLYVADANSPYKIPILPNGTAGSFVALGHAGFNDELAGAIAARANDFCGMGVELSLQAIKCQSGATVGFYSGIDVPGPFVLPACGLVYTTVVSTNYQDFAAHLIPERASTTITLTSNPITGPLVTDGSWIYYFEAAGNVRRLPIP
jgi:hypothetical protein